MKKIVLFVLPVALSLAVCAQAEKSGAMGKNYPQAPEFALKDLTGKNISLSDYRGKVVFLNFWATWCPPCRAEIPDFIEIYRDYQDKGMAIIGVSVDRDEEVVAGFVKKNEINYPVVMYTQKLISDYQPGNAIPVTIIIDPEGKIRFKKVGAVDKGFLKKWHSQLVSEK